LGRRGSSGHWSELTAIWTGLAEIAGTKEESKRTAIVARAMILRARVACGSIEEIG